MFTCHVSSLYALFKGDHCPEFCVAEEIVPLNCYDQFVIILGVV